jgi:hypothetical protein
VLLMNRSPTLLSACLRFRLRSASYTHLSRSCGLPAYGARSIHCTLMHLLAELHLMNLQLQTAPRQRPEPPLWKSYSSVCEGRMATWRTVTKLEELPCAMNRSCSIWRPPPASEV